MIILTDKKVKTRKSHRCNWCGEVINVGECARYQTGVYQQDFFTVYYHLECLDAVYKSDFGCDGEFYPYEQLRGKTYHESHE